MDQSIERVEKVLTKEHHTELVHDIDRLMKKMQKMLPDEFMQDKMIIFKRLREVNHWLRDIFEVCEFRLDEQKILEKIKNGSASARKSAIISN